MTAAEANAVDEYARLVEAYAGMVGTLYPQVVHRDLVALWHEWGAIRQRWDYPISPRADGGAPRITTLPRVVPDNE